MNFKEIVFVVGLICAPLVAVGQGLPDYVSSTVNDFADLLPPAAEAELDQTLTDLRAQSGVELVVVTIASIADYPDAPRTFETFATALFNKWGVGDATRNDGILVLVVRNDREMRIELGAGYPRAYDDIAGSVIRDVFLPSFRADDYETGISKGVAATIERIAKPHSIGALPALEDKDGGIQNWLSRNWIIVAFAGLFGAKRFRSQISDTWVRTRRCPKCGKRSLSRRRHIRRDATIELEGLLDLTTSCNNCDYRYEKPVTLHKSKGRSGGRFGGGRSSGGGSSGRW